MKIPNWQSEAINQRTDITMTKRKRTKRTNNDLHNTTQKTKDQVTRTRNSPRHKLMWDNSGFQRWPWRIPRQHWYLSAMWCLMFYYYLNILIRNQKTSITEPFRHKVFEYDFCVLKNPWSEQCIRIKQYVGI